MKRMEPNNRSVSALSGLPTVPSMLKDMIFALCVLLVLPAVHYGARPLAAAGTAVAAALVSEVLFSLFQKRSAALTEPSSVVTGLVVAMLLPVNAPLWLPAAAAAFAVLVAKGPFGFFGRTPFNPAAAGVAFAVLCWPSEGFTYFDPSEPYSLPAFGPCVFTAAKSPAAVLKEGLKPDVLPLNMIWGGGVGPLGTTAALVIGACFLFLLIRRDAKWETTVCFLLAAALIAALFPRIACSPLTSVKYELLSVSLFFCSVFMVTDPVTSPHTFPARCLYGAFAGAMTMAFRRFGAFEQGAVFAVLLANAAAPMLESAVFGLRRGKGRKNVTAAAKGWPSE